MDIENETSKISVLVNGNKVQKKKIIF